MITAKEAKARYNKLLKLRDKFIKDVIEPRISQVAETQMSISFRGVGYFYIGTSFDFSNFDSSRIGTAHDEVKLTTMIIDYLEEYGYTVTLDVMGGTEYKNGIGKIIISWQDA